MALGMRLERSLCFGSSINCEALIWLFVWLVGGEARLALAYFFDASLRDLVLISRALLLFVHAGGLHL